MRDSKAASKEGFPAVLEGSAIRAVEQWRHQPLMLNGALTPFILTVTVSFSLGDG